MQMIRCANCMKELESAVRICPFCGYDQEEKQKENALRRNTILHGRYLIGTVIGQGGFGITYVGYDLMLEMKVAVKEYFPSGNASRTGSYSNEIQWDHTDDDDESWNKGIERFLKEARRMAKLDSVPSIVRVRDAFSENQTAYIVMDFVEGETLKNQLLKNGIMKPETCFQMIEPILDSLAVIHENGFIHRDISPDNIMIQPDGKARLLDLGAAVDIRANAGQASSAVVKRNFSAPEQYMDSEALGSWTDVYAMTATIYYSLTGKVVPEALEREMKKTPLVFPEERKLPSGLQEVLTAGLELHAENRIRDMRELKEKLLKEMGGEKAKKPDKKPKKWMILAAACAVVFLGALGLRGGSKEETLEVTQYVYRPSYETDEAGKRIPQESWESDENGYYELNEDNTYTLMSWVNEESVLLNMPDTFHGKKVTAVGPLAFAGLSKLEQIRLPNTVTVLGEGIIDRCENIKAVYVPASVKKLEGRPLTESDYKNAHIMYVFESSKEDVDKLWESTGYEENQRGFGNDLWYWSKVNEVNDYHASGWREGTYNNDKFWRWFEDGFLAYGWREIDGAFYYFDTAAMTRIGWADIDGFTYYFAPENAAMVTGWREIDGAWYYFDESTGHMLTSTETPDGWAVDEYGVCEDKSYILVPESELKFAKTEDGTGIILTAYTGSGTKLRLPDQVDGLPVTEIGKDFMKGNKEITGIRLPETLVTIGDYAFEGCSSIKEIRLPKGLETIKWYAFYNTGIRTLEIPASLKSWYYGSFIQLREVSISPENTMFQLKDDILFYNDRELVMFLTTKEGSYVVPKKVKRIAAYSGVSSQLSSVTIYGGYGEIETIERFLFYGSNKLKKVVLGYGVEIIEKYAFAECDILEEVTIPESVKSIEEYAFQNCPNLKRVTISPDCQVEANAFDEGVEILYYR